MPPLTNSWTITRIYLCAALSITTLADYFRAEAVPKVKALKGRLGP